MNICWGPSCWKAALESACYCECDKTPAKVVQEVVESPSLEVLKSLLEMVLGSWLLVALWVWGGSPATSPWLWHCNRGSGWALVTRPCCPACTPCLYEMNGTAAAKGNQFSREIQYQTVYIYHCAPKVTTRSFRKCCSSIFSSAATAGWCCSLTSVQLILQCAVVTVLYLVPELINSYLTSS